jgi:hypothetical protein
MEKISDVKATGERVKHTQKQPMVSYYYDERESPPAVSERKTYNVLAVPCSIRTNLSASASGMGEIPCMSRRTYTGTETEFSVRNERGPFMVLESLTKRIAEHEATNY